jgi:hypothetical protein
MVPCKQRVGARMSGTKDDAEREQLYLGDRTNKD